MPQTLLAPPALLHAQKLAQFLDNGFKVPLLNIRFGVDFLVGLIPGVGDAVMALVSLTIVYKAGQLGIPATMQAQMLKNILLDFVLGLLPLVGDIADLFYRANQKNVRMMERWWVSQHYQAIQANSQDALTKWQQNNTD